MIEELLYQTGLRKKAQYDPHAELPFLHPGRKAAIVYDGAVIGYLGEVRKNGGEHLENYKLFDVYEGDRFKKDLSLLLTLIVFRGKDKTLEEAEITAAMNKKGLEDLGID